MSNSLNTNIKLRRASASDWYAANPILLDGEPGVELDTFKLKIGNGALPWNELPYVGIQEIPTVEFSAIVVVDELPTEGSESCLYKVVSTQKLYYWNTQTNAFAPVSPENSQNPELPNLPELPEYESSMELVDTLEDLPLIGKSEKLYKVLEDEKIYTWNASTAEYAAINSAIESKASIIVVDSFGSLPESGENDALYKINATQLLYMWNNITKTYEQLGQGSSIEKPDGFAINLQNALDSRIFATLQGDPAEIAFRYSSVDADGINDGPGIGSLIVNDIRKTIVAVPQKTNTLEISKYLSLGENTVQLIVENSEGKTATLTYQINVISLSLSTNFKDMDIYSSEVDFSFVITGAGTKTIHYIMDEEELYSESITNTNKLSHTYKIPMQTPGDHVFKVYADMEVSNMTVESNVIVLGMMYVTAEMVDTFILSTYDTKEAVQGQVINIPYLVYNPLNETSEVTLRIYQENGDKYSEKTIYVDQTVHNWILQDYPAGAVKFEIEAKSESGNNAIKHFEMDITASEFDLVPVTTNLALEFNTNGRSNDELNPAKWSYGDIEATFERFAWSVADGWLEADSGETVLRFLPKNKMTIPYQPFATDKRTTGYTIELEFATHNVKDYDSSIISCVHDGRGFVVKSQSVVFKSEQSKEIITQFKEDERVRITIVIEPQTSSRFIKIYANGVLCGVEQYKENDNFKQAEPQEITIGSDTCGLDLYKMRFYNRDLTSSEQLTNFICDRSTLTERINAKDRNNIYDISGNLTVASLPHVIPYIVLQCEELPQYKGDKKKGKSMYFIDRLRPDRCFSATGCQFDVQGTSSAGYPIKNFKVKFSDGIVYNDGTTSSGYPILEGGLVSECLCLKADYASSEQANNVMLVDYYDELVREYYLTPAQEEDPRVRTGISGRPIVVFWENTETGEIKFQGQYNMNNDKSNENVFGFDREKYPKLECWEFSNNTSDRTLFKQSEWLEEVYDKEKDKMVPAWMSDFEARFPDLDDPYSDYTQFKRFCDFIVSTDRAQATNNALLSPVTYDSVVYEYDNAEYRLAKFKNEFAEYAIVDPFIFYYIFTETFLMIDSRAKNMFLTTFDGTHWFPIPYDFDTAIGINNEGELVFEYDLEDTDFVDNEKVFNGQDSVLWINIRDAFQARRFEMYDEMRRSDKFSYATIAAKMNNHQSIWPEAIWNEDAQVKYLDTYLTEGEKYFEMCQGPKELQRDWWLFNAFKYRDSKYQCGDSEAYSAFFRAYAPGDMTVTPYQNLWPRVDYTDTYPVTQRSKRNVPNVLECPLDTASDTEIWLRSADRIASFGDLSQYKADTVKFASATKLQELILGSDAEGYENHKLTSVELGNNRLIGYLNVENCINLKDPIDLTSCYNLEAVKAKGSALSSIGFPVGGHLKALELPSTFTNLTIRNQHGIENFSMQGYDLINTIWIDDTPNMPIEDLLINTPKLDRVRIVNTTWTVSSEENLRTIFEKLKKCGGLDANGNNTADGRAVVTGAINIPSISDSFLEEINEYFKELVVYVDGKARFFIRYLNRDNSLLYKYAIPMGGDAIDPITEGLIDIPTLEGSEEMSFRFNRWSQLPTNIQGPQNVIAIYDADFLVKFLDGNETVVHQQWVAEGEAAQDPVFTNSIPTPQKASTVQYDFSFSGWDIGFDQVFSPLVVRAVFDERLRQYPVRFYNGSDLLQETMEYYGTYAEYNGNTSEIQKKLGGVPSNYYEFAYWAPNFDLPITGVTEFYAEFVFDGYLEDSWETIVNNVAMGNVEPYGLGGIKTSTITYVSQGVTHTDEVEFEIIGTNHDKMSNGEPAALTFKGTLSAKRAMNLNDKTYGGFRGLAEGGWKLCELREWLNSSEFIEALDPALQTGIKTVVKTSDLGSSSYFEQDETKKEVPQYGETEDKIFIPSTTELNITYTLTGEGQGTVYPLYTDNASRAEGFEYFTRSTATKTGLRNIFAMVNKEGKEGPSAGSGAKQIVFCFCI